MSDIPSEMCEEILTRVPMEPLLRFRCVCKTWRTIIDAPGFVKPEFDHRIGKGATVKEEDLMLTVSTNTGKLYSAGLSSLDCSFSKNIDLTCIYDGSSGRGIVASCREFILLSDFGVQDVWALYNICTGESFELPPCDDFEPWGHGVGYDSSTDDYKVVRLFQKTVLGGNYLLKIYIYSLRSKEWHKIKDFSKYMGRISNPGAFVNGALHWTARVTYKTVGVIALDLTTETYRTIPPPPGSISCFPSLYPRKSTIMHLEVWEGCLVASSYMEPGSFGVWILEYYGGGKETWVKLLSLTLPFMDFKWKLRVVAYMKAKQQVVIEWNGQMLLWFDIKGKNCLNKVNVRGDGGPFSYQVLPASLMKRSNDRLQLKLCKHDPVYPEPGMIRRPGTNVGYVGIPSFRQSIDMFCAADLHTKALFSSP